MRLSAIFLTDVASVNSFQEAEHLEMSAGDTVTVYIQLRDMSVNSAFKGYVNPGRRYMPAVGASLTVKIDTMDALDAVSLTKVCDQPYAQDPSIWRFTIAATDPVKGTKRLKLTLNEGGTYTYGLVNSAILVSSVD